MKIEKIDVCMTAVDVVVKVMRDFGAICKNCHNYESKMDSIGVCRSDDHSVLPDDFCQSFRYRDEYACDAIYQKIIEGCKLNGKELSTE